MPEQVPDESEVVRIGEGASGSVPGLMLAVGRSRLGQDGPEPGREGIVEMDAGDDLHHPPVAMAEPYSIHVPQPARVGAPVAGDGNRLVARDLARHARGPEQFVPHVAGDEAMQDPERVQHLVPVVERRCHELEQRLGVVRGEPRVGQGGAERGRMRGLREPSPRARAQALLLHAPEAAAQRLGGTRAGEAFDALVERVVRRHGRPYCSSRSARIRRAMRNDSTAAGMPQ